MVVSWPLTKENYVHGRKDKFNHAHKHTRYIYIYEYIYSCDFQNQGELDTYL